MRRRRWAHALATHAASLVDHGKKELHWFLFLCMHVILFLYLYMHGAPLDGPSGRSSSATIQQLADELAITSKERGRVV